MSTRWPSYLAIALGVTSILLSPLIGAAALAVYSFVGEDLASGHPRNVWVELGCVLALVVGFAFPFGNFALYRFAKREEAAGRPRGIGGAWIGLVLTAVGPVLVTVAFVGFIVMFCLGVVALWVTSLFA